LEEIPRSSIIAEALHLKKSEIEAHWVKKGGLFGLIWFLGLKTLWSLRCIILDRVLVFIGKIRVIFPSRVISIRKWVTLGVIHLVGVQVVQKVTLRRFVSFRSTKSALCVDYRCGVSVCRNMFDLKG